MNKKEVILIYTRPWFKDFYQLLAVQIEEAFQCEVIFFSDYAMKNVHNISPYKKDLKKFEGPLPPEYFDIVKRDRLLRTENCSMALGILKEYEIRIAALFKRYSVKFLFSATVDQFAIDMCYRQCIKEKIPFIGYHMSVLPNYTLLTSRGEINQFRIPNDNEISKAIEAIEPKSFRPDYIPKKGKIRATGIISFFSNIARVPFFFLKDITENRFNYHYKSSLKSAYSKISFGTVKSIFSHRKKLDPDNKLDIYIPLQLHPECNSEYWNRGMVYKDYEEIIFEFCKRHAKHFRIGLKEHPNMVAMRDIEFYRKILSLGVDLINVDEDNRELIKQATITVTYNSSVGIEGLVYGAQIFCIGNPLYLTNGHICCEQEMVNILRHHGLFSKTEDNKKKHLREAVCKILSMSIAGVLPDNTSIKNDKQRLDFQLTASCFARDLKKYFTDIVAQETNLENVYTYKE